MMAEMTPIEQNSEAISEIKTMVDGLPEAGGGSDTSKYTVQFVDITTTEEVRYIQINESLLNYFVSLTALTDSAFYVQVRRYYEAAKATDKPTRARGTFIGSACYYDTAGRNSVTSGIGTPTSDTGALTATVVPMSNLMWAYRAQTDIGKGLFLDAGATTTTSDDGTSTTVDNVFPVGTVIRGVVIHDKDS